MAFQPGKFLFLPFFAKKNDVIPIKNDKLGQKINVL